MLSLSVARNLGRTFAAVFLIGVLMAGAVSGFSGGIEGRWIAQGRLGVYGVVVHDDSNATKNQSITVFNHMPETWQYATGFFVREESKIFLSVHLINEEGVVPVGGILVNPETSYPQMIWLTANTWGVPLTFVNGSEWVKYGASTMCRTNAWRETAEAFVFGEHGNNTHHDHHHHRRMGNSRTDGSSTAPTLDDDRRAALRKNITKVHVVFTQHFDLGYTDFAWCVVSHYFWYILPGNAMTASAMPSYIYTTHPWLLYFFFNCEALVVKVKPPAGIDFLCPTPEVVSVVEDAILAGQMVWHAFPFDGFNEMLGKPLFDISFGFGDWLQARFFPNATDSPEGPPRQSSVSAVPRSLRSKGRLHSMQQVDVPGLCRTQVGLLLEHDVRALYIGQNPCPTFAGTVAELPNLFMWAPLPPPPSSSLRGSGECKPGASWPTNTTASPLLVFTHKYGYGGLGIGDAIIDPPSQSALLVQCTMENRPPYTPQDIAAYLERVAAEFPDCDPANVVPSTYDAFASDVMSVGWPREDLLLYTHDIGDPWVRALASDPIKTKAFLQQRRAFEGVPIAIRNQSAASSTELLNEAIFTVTGCEHNWGMPWQSDWQVAVYSYQEKRDMLVGNYTSFSARESTEETQEQHQPSQQAVDSPHRSVVDRVESHGDGLTYTCVFMAETPPRNAVGLSGAGTLGSSWLSNVTVSFNENTGALTSLFSTTASGSSMPLLDDLHPLFSLLYVVHETTGPFAQQALDGWGDPEPDMVDNVVPPTLIALVPLQDGSCGFVVTATLSQTYWNNNTYAYTQPTNNASATLLLTSTLVISAATEYDPPPQQLPNLTVSLSLNVSGLLPSDVDTMYQSWNELYSYGDSFDMQFSPIGAEGRWTVESLGATYSPYDFGPAGTCNYHVADAMHATFASGSSSTQSLLSPIDRKSGEDADGDRISLLYSRVTIRGNDSQLFLFGWNNASWTTQVNTSTELCEVNDAYGVWANLWNQWNANWVVGFPWRKSDSEAMVFGFEVTFS